MFDLTKQKQEMPDIFRYELEKKLADKTAYDELKKTLEERAEEMKTMLRKGETKEQFVAAEILLQGYLSCLKVAARVKK